MRPAPLRFLAILAVIAVTVPALPARAETAQYCSSCHSTTNPAGGYVLVMPELSVSFPAVVPPGAAFNVSLTVDHPGKYTARNPAPRLDVGGSGSLAPGDSPSRKIPSLGENGATATATWSLVAGGSSGPLYLNASVEFTARHRHSAGEDNDEDRFVLRRYTSVDVRPVELYVTESDLKFTPRAGRERIFEMVSTSDLKNITLVPAAGLEGAVSVEPAFVEALGPGQRQTVRVGLSDTPGVFDNGRLDILWENVTGARNATFAMVRVLGSEAGTGDGNTVRWIGRLTGLLSLGLLVASVALGYMKGGWRRRVRVHCAVSWFILGLGLYHGISLALFPYNRVWLNGPVALGYVTAAAMGLSSVNGLLQRQWTRRQGRRNWLWFHRLSLLAAIALLVVHAVLMGTDLRFIRDGLFPGRHGQ